jgi:capsid protein
MANNASVMFRTQYENRVRAIYQQRGGRLRGTVSQATRFDGSSEAKFFLAGKSVAKETTAAGQLNTPSGMGITTFTIPLRTWTVYEHVYDWDEDRLSVDEKEIIFDAGAMAIGRTTDIEVFAAAYAKVTTFTPECDFSAGAFSAASASDMIKKLQQQIKKWDGEVYCPLPAQAWNEFLMNKIVNSADQVSRDDLPFMKMTASRFWNGVNFFLYEEEDPGDMYPIPASNKQDILMYHRTALGWAAHTDLNVKTQWHNEKDTLSINMKLKGNATTLQEGNGIVRARLRSIGPVAQV